MKLSDSGFLRTLGSSFLLLVIVAPVIVTPVIVTPMGFCQDLPLAPPGVRGEGSSAPAEPVREATVTAESVSELSKRVADATDLSDENKAKLEKDCTRALEALKRTGEFLGLSKRYQADTETVRERVAQLRQELEALKQPREELPTYLELAELEQEVARREVALATLKTARLEAEAEPAQRVKRRQEIRPLLLSAEQRLATVQAELDAPVSPDESPLVTQIRRAGLMTSLRLIEAEQPALHAELAKYDAEDSSDLLRVERDLRTQAVSIATSELEALRTVLSQRRAADTAAAVTRAKREVEATPPELRSQAEENVAFAEAAHKLSPAIEQATRQLERSATELEELQKQFKMTEQRVSDIGLTGSIGAMLRRQRIELPDLRERRKNIQDRKTQIEDLQYQWFDYDDLRSESEQEAIKRTLAEVEPSRRKQLEQAAETVVQQRRSYLNGVIRNYKAYLDTLFELDATEQKLIRETKRSAAYIDERIMWIRSNRVLFSPAAIDDSTDSCWSWQAWREVGEHVRLDASVHWPLYTLALGLWAVLVLGRRRIIRRLEALGELAARRSCVRFAPTVRAGLISLLLAFTWPLPLMFLGWRLDVSAGGTEFTHAVSEACMATAWLFGAIEIVRWVCHRQGLGPAHFDWPVAESHVIRSNLRWVKAPSLLLVFITSLIYAIDREHGADTVERVGLVLGMVMLSLLVARLLRPEDGIFSSYLQTHRGNWIERLKHVWYWGCVMLPLVLAIMAIAGYYYTARVVVWRVYLSFMLWIVLQILGAGLRRLLFVRQRAIRRQQAWEQRDAELASRSQLEEEGTQIVPEDLVPVEELQQDIAANSAQTKRLIHSCLVAAAVVGMWMIWVDVLPALRMLDRWPLWTNEVQAVATAEVPELAETEGMPMTPKPVVVAPTQKVEVVTVGDLALAVLLGIITFVSARNIPGLMEISILQRLPLENSVRYAIKTLTSYVIVLLGVALAFQAISIGWSKVQWLATALMFGLAFGLQEIFANSMAGLILLFEQPIRVGDVITIDDITGVVSRMRIRATTVTNWDRKEYIIPNKEFITGRVLNWTLSDKTNRIVINVGIAYGSNVELAKEILLEICRKNPLTLDDPPPMVTFEGFGDNTLDLVVRTYLPDLTHRMSVTDELYTKFEAAFREQEIEIAFPQRDLHIRSVDEAVWKQIQSGEAKVQAKGQA